MSQTQEMRSLLSAQRTTAAHTTYTSPQGRSLSMGRSTARTDLTPLAGEQYLSLRSMGYGGKGWGIGAANLHSGGYDTFVKHEIIGSSLANSSGGNPDAMWMRWREVLIRSREFVSSCACLSRAAHPSPHLHTPVCLL